MFGSHIKFIIFAKLYSYTITHIKTDVMLYIRNFNIEGVKAYYAVPTKKSELDEGIIVTSVKGFHPSANRIIAGCVVQCNLATILGASAKDNKGVLTSLPVFITPYLAATNKSEAAGSPFTEDNVGNRLIISDISITSGTHITAPFNPLASLTIRKHLNALNSHMLLPAIEQFKGINIGGRFTDKDTKERLVFIDDPDNGYNNETIFAIDHKAFTTSIVDGVTPEIIKSIDGAHYLYHLDDEGLWLRVDGEPEL
jgi:hypothetical protein